MNQKPASFFIISIIPENTAEFLFIKFLTELALFNSTDKITRTRLTDGRLSMSSLNFSRYKICLVSMIMSHMSVLSALLRC